MHDRDVRTGAVVAFVVVAWHVAIVAMLLRTPPGYRSPATRNAAEQPLQIEFVPRRATAAARMPTRTARPTARIRSDNGPAAVPKVTRTSAEADTAWRARADDAASAVPLDLTLPQAANHPPGMDAPDQGFDEPDLAPRRTRFDRAWVSDGNALEQARFRSRAVGAVLGLFGRPPRRCTEVERRLRVPDCLPLDADAGDTEALRRTLD